MNRLTNLVIILVLINLILTVEPLAANDSRSRAIQLPGQSTRVVVDEGEREPRSIGSYCLRIYSGRNPEYPYDEFLTGMILARDGTLEKILVPELDQDGRPEIVIIIRSVGSGGYLSADAFSFDGSELRLLGQVSGLAADADPVQALQQRLQGTPEQLK